MVTITLFLLTFALVPFLPLVSQAVQQSTVANRLVAAALELIPTVEAGLGQDLEGGLPSLVVARPCSVSQYRCRQTLKMKTCSCPSRRIASSLTHYQLE